MNAARSSSVAVVTGAGRGLGLEIARRLAGRGHAVLATDIDAEAAAAAAETIGGGAWSMALDVRDPDAHRSAAAAASERGRLDVWVNNAGALRLGKVWEIDDDDVRLQLDVNLAGVIWGSRAAVDAMRSVAGGRTHLINIGSLSSVTPAPGLSVYAATKHAVLGFSASLQGDLALAGVPVSVHCVCPDGVDTEMLRQQAGDSAPAMTWTAPRILTPEEVADQTVALLGSRQLLKVIPRRRGWLGRAVYCSPGLAMRFAKQVEAIGRRRRASRFSAYRT